MNYKNTIAISALLLQGCTMSQFNDDMMSNKFLEYQPVTIDLEGKFSAAIGPSISTYVINKDGTGIYCYFFNGTVFLHRLKFYDQSNGKLSMVSEAGIISKIIKKDEGDVVIESYGSTFALKPDNNLEHSNIPCKEKLSKLD